MLAPNEGAAGATTSRPLSVLLTTEGTYPHLTGGVSTWCHFLLNGLRDVQFSLLSLTMNPFVRRLFPIPANVASVQTLPLWGTDEPSWYLPGASPHDAARLASRTTERLVELRFVPQLHTFFDLVTARQFDPAAFARLLAGMQETFRDLEYRAAWRSEAVWEAFRERLLAQPQSSAADGADGLVAIPEPTLWRDEPAPAAPDPTFPTVAEAVEGVRWLYRMLTPVALATPEVDLVHTTAAGFCAIPGIVAKVERGTPLLLTEHGVYVREQYLAVHRAGYPFHLKRLLLRAIEAVVRTTYALADQVSPVCAFNGRWERALGVPARRVRVIHNGVDEREFRPVRVKRSKRPTVVAVSRVDPLKDLQTMVRVADRVRREIPDVLFVHHGPVADRGYWAEVREEVRRRRLGRTVEFRGPTSEVTAAINRADLMLLTSISEAFPFTLIEGLMCGKPVVATAVGGVREALDGTGVTAPVGDDERLAEAVVALLRLPADQRQLLSQAARERARDSYTLGECLRQYRESYAELTGTALAPAAATEPRRAATAEAAEVAATAAQPVEASEPRAEQAATAGVGTDAGAAVYEAPRLPDVEELVPAAGPEPLLPEPLLPERLVEEAPAGEARPGPEPTAEPVLPEAEPVVEPAEAAPATPLIGPAEVAPPTPLPEPEITVEDLRLALADSDPFVRAGALERLQRNGNAIELVVAAIDDEYPIVRREAVRALARLNGPRAGRVLADAVAADPSSEVRAEAVEALATVLARRLGEGEAR